MIIDTSAIVAIIFEEPEREQMLEAVSTADRCFMSTATLFETSIVIDGTNDVVLTAAFDNLIDDLGIQPVDLTVRHVWLARQAYRAYGKGSGHPARLNFGDCFSYALAIDLGEPLLFKGNDFIHTDVRIAQSPTP